MTLLTAAYVRGVGMRVSGAARGLSARAPGLTFLAGARLALGPRSSVPVFTRFLGFPLAVGAALSLAAASPRMSAALRTVFASAAVVLTSQMVIPVGLSFVLTDRVWTLLGRRRYRRCAREDLSIRASDTTSGSSTTANAGAPVALWHVGLCLLQRAVNTSKLPATAAAAPSVV
ncbi:hypothetical protein ColKHC_05637 [Colletotrichum higginsianum]|uniref:Uncharacterized protein n=1 Tax=Colletotrichum higginsianum TaxID=80884 RepID=A0A4T0VTP2_9PEZI|nr:hypothetical protein CH35J_008249 [Colletotrichum higginsianum]GJC96811.1 hypothetical protein ColKHC_05637 [Colletotrichum higginsianum]